MSYKLNATSTTSPHTFSGTLFSLSGVSDTATAATHYFVETATDGYIRPKTLANVKTEIVTTAAVNSAAATTVGTITSGTWQGGVISATYIDTAIARLAGPTFTGTVTAGGNIVQTKADARFYSVGTKGTNWGFAFNEVTGSGRWAILTDAVAESGSNAGTNLSIYRYSDASAYLGAPVNINRSSGLVTLENNLAVGGTVYTGTSATATAASHYWVATGSDGIIRPKTLANVKTEIVTTAAVNSAAATTVGTITSGTWNGSVIGATYIDTAIARLAGPTFTGTVTAATLDLTTAATATAATSYWVETGSDGVVRPKTLANVKTEVVTTAAVNSAAATTLGTVTTGVWNGTAIANGYIASALTGKTYNGLSLTAAATGFTIAGGTASKTLTVNNTIALSGTDSTTITLPSTSGTVPLNNQTMYIGTTAVAINRASANLALTGITSIDGSAASATTATTATKSTNIVGGNSTTLLGSLPYQSNTDTTTLLGPNTTATKKFLRMTGTGTNGAAPAWDTLVDGDVPSALTGKTYNALTLTAAATGFTVAGGTTSKTLTVSNSITLAGTDATTITLPSTTGTVPLNNQTFYLGTTGIAINRASAGSHAIAGITVDAGVVTTGTLPVARGGTGVTTSTGTGNVVLSANPTFTGAPLAPTAAQGTNDTKIATTAFVRANSVPLAAAATAGFFDNTTTVPNTTTRLNYGGYFYPTYINLSGSSDTTTAATHYFVETGSDGYVRPKTLANVRKEIEDPAADYVDLSVASQSTANATQHIYSLTTENYDANGWHTNAGSPGDRSVFVPTAGIYSVAGQVAFTTAAGGNVRNIKIERYNSANAPMDNYIQQVAPRNPGATVLSCAGIFVCSAGDYIQLSSYQDSTAAMLCNANLKVYRLAEQ